ncbi:MAG: rhombotarget lipoprotein [Steroidobacteraceae bacterium]
MSPALRHRFKALAAALAVLPGCAQLDSFCFTSCRSQHAASTPLVSYLYPEGDVPRVEESVQLRLPLRVGLSFLPAGEGAAPDAAQREQIVERVAERFRSLEYVSSITVVPDYYLTAGGGFAQLEQVSALLQLDLVGVMSYDQIARSTENDRSLWYLTIVGAYLVSGHDQSTSTLLDLAVVEPHSRRLLLRAGGTSSVAGATTISAADRKLRMQSAAGFEQAADSLIENLAGEVGRFETRVKAGDAPVRTVARDGGGGAITCAQLVAIGLLLLGALAARRTRDDDGPER